MFFKKIIFLKHLHGFQHWERQMGKHIVCKVSRHPRRMAQSLTGLLWACSGDIDGQVFQDSLGKKIMSVPLGFGFIFSGWVTPVLNCTFSTSSEIFVKRRNSIWNQNNSLIWWGYLHLPNLGLIVNSNHWTFHCLF